MSLTEQEWNLTVAAEKLQQAMKTMESARDQLGAVAALRYRLGTGRADVALQIAEMVDEAIERAASFAEDLDAAPGSPS